MCVITIDRSFSSYLNFNTFLSSAYSSAMVAVMSNWSIVMDAGVRCAGPASDQAGGVYLFFFLLRITLVWIVIPTLMVSRDGTTSLISYFYYSVTYARV